MVLIDHALGATVIQRLSLGRGLSRVRSKKADSRGVKTATAKSCPSQMGLGVLLAFAKLYLTIMLAACK